ncbi:hypothetical protein C8J56DRAFT_893160 [Mycena floridula]|nr:hypothetical protein C8J56DRAFT_893160 [Mycena floridula]
MSDNPQYSSTGMLANSQKLQGRNNFPGWKKDFTLLAESKGYTGYYSGAIAKPSADPTHDVTMTVTDPSGGTTITIVSTPVKSTSTGSDKPMIHEWTIRNGGANITLKDSIVDPDLVGFKEEDTTNDFIAGFVALRKAAIQAGVNITDANAKNWLISVVSENKILRAVAFGLPTNSTFADTNAKLSSTHFFQRNQVRKQQAEATKVQAMVAQALSAQALSRPSSQSTKKKEKDGREKNIASDICTNRFHGLAGGKGHKTENCWEEGGANIVNKPPHWKSRPTKAHEFDTPTANSTSTTAPVTLPQVAAASIGVPEVFIFSTALGDRLSDSAYSSLSERLDIPPLEAPDNDKQVSLLQRLGPSIPIQIDDTDRYISEYREDDVGNIYH